MTTDPADKSRLRERLDEIVKRAMGCGPFAEIADALIAAGVTLPPEPESEREKFARAAHERYEESWARASAYYKRTPWPDCASAWREWLLAEADLLLAERDRAVAEAKRGLQHLASMADTLSPQEVINVCADALGVPRWVYAGPLDPNRSLIESAAGEKRAFNAGVEAMVSATLDYANARLSTVAIAAKVKK